MKSILFIHSSAELYGSDRSLLYLVKYLDKSKFCITVLLPCEGMLSTEMKKIENIDVLIFEVATLRRKNLNVIGIIKYVKSFIISMFFLIKLIKKKSIDVVYTNVSVVFPGAMAAKYCGIKSIWHIREIVKNNVERVMISKIVNQFSDLIIVNSKATGEAIKTNGNTYAVVYNAVEEQDEYITRCDKEHIVIGMAGRINRWKGQKLFVDCAMKIHKQYPEIVFLIAGSPYSGEEYLEEELRRYIASYELCEVVKILGWIDNMKDFYHEIDIFILPSIEPEPFGLVVIEAMEYCLPVVATNHGGPVEIIENRVDGFLVDYNASNEMVNVILELIEDGQFRTQIGENARKKKRKIFNIQNSVNQIEKILDYI